MGRFEASLLVVAILVFITFITQQIEKTKDLCTEAGGVSIQGHKGHFEACLDPNAVIKLP